MHLQTLISNRGYEWMAFYEKWRLTKTAKMAKSRSQTLFSCSLRRKQQVFNIDDDASLKAKG
jgi:hypothetical protein